MWSPRDIRMVKNLAVLRQVCPSHSTASTYRTYVASRHRLSAVKSQMKTSAHLSTATDAVPLTSSLFLLQQLSSKNKKRRHIFELIPFSYTVVRIIRILHLYIIMPPRAEDIVVEEAIAASSAAAVDGEQFFASTAKQEQSTDEVSSGDAESKSQKNKTSFNSFLSSIHRDLENFGTSLENGFIDAIDRSPLGVNTDKSKQEVSAARTSSAVSPNEKKREELSSPWYNDAPEEEGDDKPALERKGSSVAKAAKKGAVAVGGGALIGVGVVMIPTLPPPFASITMLGGYALLGTEFEGPRKVVKNARDKMRDIEDADDEENDEEPKEGEAEESDESSTEIEKEFTEGENKEMLQSETQTAAEYFGYGRSDTSSTSEQKDNNKSSKKKKNPVKKAAQKLSKKYVLPALEKVCSAYEKFEDKHQVAKEEGFEVVEGEAGEEYTVSKEQGPAAPKEGDEEKRKGKDDQQETMHDVPACAAEEKKEDDKEEEFVDAKEDWIDVDEDTAATATDESEDDAVLV